MTALFHFQSEKVRLEMVEPKFGSNGQTVDASFQLQAMVWWAELVSCSTGVSGVAHIDQVFSVWHVGKQLRSQCIMSSGQKRE